MDRKITPEVEEKIRESIRRGLNGAEASRHRSLLYQQLKGYSKTERLKELVGCSIEKLRTHLENKFQPGMTWENYGPVWHIDHIKPCRLFDLKDPDQVKACFHFKNLQPLFAKANRSKNRFFESK